MPSPKKQSHKQGSKLTADDKQSDYEARATSFRTAFEALQLEHKVAVMPKATVNPNGTLGAINHLIDLKNLPEETKQEAGADDHAG